MELPPFIILKNPIELYSGMTGKYKEINVTEFDGFYKDILLYLQNKMGFIPVVTLTKPTTEYNELVEEVANGLFDIVMSTIIVTEKRSEIVDFSVAVLPSSIRVVTRKQNSIKPDYIFFLKPFTFQLWLLILGTFIFTAILIYWFELPIGGYGSDNISIRNIATSINYTLHIMLGRNSHPVKSPSAKILSLGLYFIQIILFTAYTAGLLASIIIENGDTTVSGIDDIKNGKISSAKIGIVVGSAVEDYYLTSVSQGKKDYYPLKTPDEIYTNLINGNIDAGLWNNLTIEYHTNNIYCTLIPVGVEFSHSSYSLPVKKDWLYKADLNFNILSLIKSEDLDRISSKWLTSRVCSKADASVMKNKPIPLESTVGLFILFFIICFICILVRMLQKLKCIRRIFNSPPNSSSAIFFSSSQSVTIDS